MGQFLNFLKNFFGGVWHFLLDYIHIALPEEKAIILKDLLTLADPIVSDLNNQSLSGSQKRDAAFTAISAAILKIGKDVAASLVYLAVELAVQRLKSLQPTTPVAPGGVLPGGNTVAPTP